MSRYSRYGRRTYGGYHPENYKYRRISEGSRLPPEAQAIFAIIVLLALIYVFIIQPFINWVKTHIFLFSMIIVIILIICIISVYFYIKNRRKKKLERLAFEEEQRARGLVSFTDRYGKEVWDKLEEIEKLKKIDEEEREKEKLFNRIIEEIRDFKPAREQLRNEYAYHLSLYSWLKKTFPQAEYEKQRGSSRPDIVIEEIAIEVKGPTDATALTTIADKCMRYAHHYKEGLIVVLFEVNVNEYRYNEWLSSLNRQFPHVKVIRK